MNQIQGTPNDYDFGLSFNYAVWTANTDITLTNVPWDNNYRDVVQFDSTNALNQYINEQATTNVRISNSVYAKADQPISIDVPFNRAQLFNYVRVYNPAQPVNPSVGGLDTPKYFYYFVTNVRYVAPNTTEIQVQLDVYQTYIRSVRFGRCYVERGHVGIANRENFRNYGRDFLTVQEGLDTGSEYMVVEQTKVELMSLSQKSPSVGYSILICATADLNANPGTVGAPLLVSARGSNFQGLPSGASYYIFTSANDFVTFMRTYSDKPWITQSIISITVIPVWSRYWTNGHMGAKLGFGGYNAPGASTGTRLTSFAGNWRDKASIRNYIPPRYRHLKKFYTYPYMAVRISSNGGQQVVLQPENWNNSDGTMREMSSFLPPNQRVSVIPLDYNSNLNRANSNEINGDGMDRQVTIGNFPTLALVNNGAIGFMAANANTLAYGYSAANWSQQKALRGNQVGYDQATSNINAATDLANIGMGADSASTAIANQLANDSSMLNLIGGTASGAGMGAFAGPLGAIAGGIGGAASGVMGLMGTNNQVNASNAQLANRMSSGSASANVQSGAAGYMRDTNKALSDWAAKGDYESSIAGMKAKIQDAQLTPSSLSGQSGGEAMNLLNGQAHFRYEVIMPDQAIIQSIGEYWLRYGYAVDRFMFLPPNLMAMSKFTYWKLKETYIGVSPIPEGFKQAIRGIFEKGVTVWSNPADMGYIDTADNQPLPGIVIDGYEPVIPDPEPDPDPPTPTKRKQKKMIVFGTVSTVPGSEGNLWALAGTSPGTTANWLETSDATRKNAYVDATGQSDAVGVTEAEFFTLKDLYMSPVEVFTPGGEPA